RPTGIPVVDQILAGGAPETMRAAAARGALPVSRELMLTVLVHLTGDPEPAVRAAAAESIDGFPVTDLTSILGNVKTSPSVLDHFALRHSLAHEPLAALVANPSLEPDSVVSIAASGSPDAID